MRRQPSAPYSSHEMARLGGISYRTLDYWIRTGLVRPSVLDAHGSGTARRYSDSDLNRVRAIVVLLRCGFSLQRIRPMFARKDNEWRDVLVEVAENLVAVSNAPLRVPA